MIVTLTNNWETITHTLDNGETISANAISEVMVNGKWYKPTLKRRYNSYSDHGHQNTVTNYLMEISFNSDIGVKTEVLDRGSYKIKLKTTDQKNDEKHLKKIEERKEALAYAESMVSEYQKRVLQEKAMLQILLDEKPWLDK